MLQIVNGNTARMTKAEAQRRQDNENKLKVSAENITPPAWLSTGAKSEFNRLVKLFENVDLFTEADINDLAVYCDLLMEYKSCNARLKKNGRSINGKPNPDLRMKLQISQAMDRVAKNLGLNPASRASLAISMKQEEDDDEDF